MNVITIDINHLAIRLLALVLSLAALPCHAQQTIDPTYGLVVLKEEGYLQLIRQDSSKRLVDLERFIPGIRTDIRYAGKNNFIGEAVYQTAKAFLSLPAARALREVDNELNRQGYGLKIFDAYRPYHITVLFYEKVKDTVYVASPYRGSRHNRGSAVDLTIVTLRTGKELAMPTPFDDFTVRAHANYPTLPRKIKANRELLKSVMTRHGFEVYPDEWWHYDFKGWRQHPVLDVNFQNLD